MCIRDRDKARSNDFNTSFDYKSLNGKWKFNWVSSYKKRPVNFYKTDFDDSAWNEIEVPANWEINGYGNALYTNHPYEFCPRNPQPPLLPEENPVGSYRKYIEIPEQWNGKEKMCIRDSFNSSFLNVAVEPVKLSFLRWKIPVTTTSSISLTSSSSVMLSSD